MSCARSPTARLVFRCTERHNSTTRARLSCASQRKFHSYQHPPSPGSSGVVEDAILAAAYKHVPEHGFTKRALGLGARDAGYLDISPSILPDGQFSLIRHHLAMRREALAGRCAELFGGAEKQPGIGAKVFALTRDRLLANGGIIRHWQDALAVMAQPSYAPASIKELAMLADEIWFLAGDKTVDSSWYTKRASLSMIYTSSELFMTNDTSPDFVETMRFLDRRLKEVNGLGTAVSSVGQWVGFTMNAGLNVLRSRGVRV